MTGTRRCPSRTMNSLFFHGQTEKYFDLRSFEGCSAFVTLQPRKCSSTVTSGCQHFCPKLFVDEEIDAVQATLAMSSIAVVLMLIESFVCNSGRAGFTFCADWIDAVFRLLQLVPMW